MTVALLTLRRSCRITQDKACQPFANLITLGKEWNQLHRHKWSYTFSRKGWEVSLDTSCQSKHANGIHGSWVQKILESVKQKYSAEYSRSTPLYPNALKLKTARGSQTWNFKSLTCFIFCVCIFNNRTTSSKIIDYALR